jgi:hypothetical protein
MPGTNIDEDQYQAILELEQDRWVSSEWNQPDSHVVSESPSSPGEDISSDDGSGIEEDSRDQFSQNDYVKQLWDAADLHILQPGEVREAMGGSTPELSLFHLFLSRNFLDAVWRWTNESLEKKGRKRCTKIEFNAYIGLEMGMSLMKFNDIQKYWSSGCFLGHDTFRSTMSRDRFKQIRGCVCFSSPSFYDADEANADPLWTCRTLLDNFIKKCAAVAVPVGVSALDECTCATKARTRAKTYIPIKPDKYGIRFYAVVGDRYCYMSSFFDNRASNNTGIPGPTEYHRIFRDMRTP